MHRHLPPPTKLYRQKNHDEFNAGVADCWYSGPCRDLWVEYKFLSDGKIPVRAAVDLVTKQRYLSSLQLDWLNERHSEGRNVWVIVGCKDGGVVYRKREWELQFSPDVFREFLMSRARLASEIERFVGVKP